MIPLLSTTYLAFISPDAISEISDSDLEKEVDRIGRTARRSVDTHIRNIFSLPRACTSIRRMSALYTFSANLPSIVNEFKSPELTLPSVDSAAGSGRTSDKIPTRLPSTNLEHPQSPSPGQAKKIGSGVGSSTKAMAARQGPGTDAFGQATTGTSSTEAEEDDDDSILVPSRKQPRKGKGIQRSAATVAPSRPTSRTSNPASSVPGSHMPASVARSGVPSKAPSSDSDSPARPNKRARAEGQDRSDDDSDDIAKRGELRWRGTKQPIKRGGRRF